MRQLTTAADTLQISWSVNLTPQDPVIQTFTEEDAVSIREARVATSSSIVVSDLVHVKSYFRNLPGVIVSLEARDLPLIESVKIMHTIQEGLKQTPGPVASEPINYQKQPSQISALLHLTTPALYSQKRSDSFIDLCEKI
uniref:(California timema) hypothetical protein n=1 Tax=Timema californicum TaxID=61474 RepID=A0A7R9P9E7_TIMCA|nr:unnamed protein product [Timema californicum]